MQKHKLSLIATATLAAVLALAIYGYTLAPSVENGDVAELEYIPYRLGSLIPTVTHFMCSWRKPGRHCLLAAWPGA